MLLEVVAEIEQRLPEDAALHEQERDQQPSDSSIAVQERMDGLELRVGKCCLDQYRCLVVRVEVALEAVERLVHVGNGRRDERSAADRGARWTDPVLRGTKLSGGRLRASAVPQKAFMDLPYQPKR